MVYSILLANLFSSISLIAAEKPRALATDQRIKVVSYEDNQVYPIHANTFVETQIQFNQGEFIEDIQNGDLAAWQAKVPNGLPNMLFIKPTIVGSDTNMTVVTNRRTYYFQLISDKETSLEKKDITYAVKFVYPEEEQKRLEAQLRYQRSQHKANLSTEELPSHLSRWIFENSLTR